MASQPHGAGNGGTAARVKRGVLWVSSRLTAPETLSPEAFTRWYDDVHVPDLLGITPTVITAAWRYHLADGYPQAPMTTPTEAPWPFRMLYKVSDMERMADPGFKGPPFAHPSLPGGRPVTDFAEFDTRFADCVERWRAEWDATGTPKRPTGRTPILVSEIIELPEGTPDSHFRRLYTSEMQEVAQIPGWRESNLFKIRPRAGTSASASTWGPPEPLGPTYLNLHEFGEEPGAGDGGRDGRFDRLLGFASGEEVIPGQKIKVAVFRLVRGFGDEAVDLVTSDAAAVSS